jgi:O-antigen/teichoic acid export membrane protein
VERDNLEVNGRGTPAKQLPMSRFKRFAHSLFSGYVLLGANILYTLASVPLALHYLSMKEFGLWALVMQVCNFNQIVIDLGMSGAIARILIDHKDDQNSTAYGTVILTGSLVLLVQGGLIAALGGLISYWLPQWMNVEVTHWHDFRLLVFWQCVLLAVSFSTRIFGFILHAHQRFDICNYSNLAGLAVGLAGLWVGFASGWGLYSMLLGGAAITALNGVTTLWQTWRLHLFPAPGRWGKPNRRTFKEMFFYGTDLFLVSIGLQLITASQAPIISRALGLEAVAIWSVATKLFTLAQQLVFRLLDFSWAAFPERMVRGEGPRLQSRFRDMIILSGSASAALGVTMAICNRAFLSIWTHDRISWPVENDCLMACSLMVYAWTRGHIGLACITKKVGAMKYVYLAEGLSFIGLGLALSSHFGLGGVIVAGFVTNILFSGVYGMIRTTKYFNLQVSEIFFRWMRPPALVWVCVLLAAAVMRYVTLRLSPLPQLLICGATMGAVASFCFWKMGLPDNLRREALGKLTEVRARFFTTG